MGAGVVQEGFQGGGADACNAPHVRRCNTGDGRRRPPLSAAQDAFPQCASALKVEKEELTRPLTRPQTLWLILPLIRLRKWLIRLRETRRKWLIRASTVHPRSKCRGSVDHRWRGGGV